MNILSRLFGGKREERDDYINWSKVNKMFSWVAAEKNNMVYAWRTKPRIFGTGWNTGMSHIGPRLDGTDAIIGPLPPWRDSLRKRPSK
jgi:hypothetical protein